MKIIALAICFALVGCGPSINPPRSQPNDQPTDTPTDQPTDAASSDQASPSDWQIVGGPPCDQITAMSEGGTYGLMVACSDGKLYQYKHGG
jgi:hypothetical protein